MTFIKSGLILLTILSCQGRTNLSISQTTEDTISVKDDLSPKKQVQPDTTFPNTSLEGQLLVLTPEGLQLVHAETGKTTEVGYGMPQEELVNLVNSILQVKSEGIELNSECGAGPLRIATWQNGLGILFQESEARDEWQFVGWSVNDRSAATKNLTTMSGIGVGSTRLEMEEVYTIEVSKTSLGEEFSTDAGLYGIFDKPGIGGRITNMWSGVSCNFR